MNIETKNLTKVRIRNMSLKRASVISSMMALALVTWLGSGVGMASAEQMEIINATRVVSALVDEVWNIVSDVDKDPQYWTGIKEVKNVNTNSNMVIRDVTVLNNAKAHQIITFHPENSIVVNQTEGPITGIRTMTLSPSDDNSNKTKIDVLWNIDLSGIPIIGRGFAKDNIFKSTEEALNRIANAVEKGI